MKHFKNYSSKTAIIAIVLSLLLTATSVTLSAGEKEGKGYLGASISDLSHQEKKDLGISHGVRVSGVSEGEAAEKAGLKEDDVIQFFAGEKIYSPGDLVEAVRAQKPGDKVSVKILRDGKAKTLSVTLGEYKTRWGWLGEKESFFGTRGGYLGVQLHSLNEELGKYFGVKPGEGALVLDVAEDSPAREAGMKAGDVILNLDGEDVKDPGAVSKILGDLKKGDKVKIKVVRHNKTLALDAELGAGQGFSNFKILKGLKGEAGVFPPGFRFYTPGHEDYKMFQFEDFKEKRDKKKKEAVKKLESRMAGKATIYL